jgi:thymidylate synthase (FAD)
MSVRVIVGDALDELRKLPDESVHCCVTSPRDGRFQKGERRSPATEFKPGQHWRPAQAFRDAAWLFAEYVNSGRSASEIAAQFCVSEGAIHFWLRKHGIPRRSISEARALKRWGALGAANPMFGKTGPANPHYIDGSSPERQRLYARGAGRDFIKRVYARDGYRCVRCSTPKGGPRSLHAHHVRPWAGNPALRFDDDNAVTLCRPCHSWVHSKANIDREYLA